jgi:hypothetical protein
VRGSAIRCRLHNGVVIHLTKTSRACGAWRTDRRSGLASLHASVNSSPATVQGATAESAFRDRYDGLAKDTQTLNVCLQYSAWKCVVSVVKRAPQPITNRKREYYALHHRLHFALNIGSHYVAGSSSRNRLTFAEKIQDGWRRRQESF